MQVSSAQTTVHFPASLAWVSTVVDEEAILSTQERAGVDANEWFASLPATLRHDILRNAKVKRYRHGETIVSGQDACAFWLAGAKGALCVGVTTPGGKAVTLDYVAPGQWMGENLLLSEEPNAYDIYAHGDTTTLQIPKRAFLALFDAHESFRMAIMRKQREDSRLLYEKVVALKTLGLGPRLAKTLLDLAGNFGVTFGGCVRIVLPLSQGHLAQLVGASRQRVNLELKFMREKAVIRIGPDGFFVQDMTSLRRMSQSADESLVYPVLRNPAAMPLMEM